MLGAGLIGLALCFSSTWRGIELKTFDWLTVYTASIQASLPIAIVAVDEESMAAINQQWPWAHSLHATLLERLREAGAAVVAFDIVFAELAGDHKEDRAFARHKENLSTLKGDWPCPEIGTRRD